MRLILEFTHVTKWRGFVETKDFAPAVHRMISSLIDFCDILVDKESLLKSAPLMGTCFQLHRRVEMDLEIQESPPFFHLFAHNDTKYLTLGEKNVRKAQLLKELFSVNEETFDTNALQRITKRLATFSQWKAAEECKGQNLFVSVKVKALSEFDGDIPTILSFGQARTCFKVLETSYTLAYKLLTNKRKAFQLPFEWGRKMEEYEKLALKIFDVASKKLKEQANWIHGARQLLDKVEGEFEDHLQNVGQRNTAILEDPQNKALKRNLGIHLDDRDD